ncbi:MAG: hypothetical protein RBR95_03335 [Ignavibacteriaceae bacterium]|jgi:hypothetical protein|nr:hypothetical protein [Ignavibacteriaceae bacterium]
MKTKRISLLALGLLALIVLPFIAGCGAKTNDIVEVSYVEKKEIDGSTMRVYAFQVKNFIDNRMIWGELEEFSRMQTYKPGDNTVIYFFEKKRSHSRFNKNRDQFDRRMQKMLHCRILEVSGRDAGFYSIPVLIIQVRNIHF